jgi:hypothetical protein
VRPLDLARFAPADPEPIVAAAFACPYCLCAPTVSVLVSEPEALVRCACGPCEAEWDVALDDGQALRMQLAPPGQVWLQRAPG